MRHCRATLLLIFLLSLAGCGSGVHSYELVYPSHRTDSTVLSFDLFPAQDHWEREVRKRYPNSLLVISHGGTKDGVWYAKPSFGPPVRMETLIDTLRKQYPDRRIVIVACNPDNLTIPNREGVTYATDDVWVIPDSPHGPATRDFLDPQAVGSIWEFKEY